MTAGPLYSLRVDEVSLDDASLSAPDVPCPVCASLRSRPRFQLDGLPHRIRQCEECGLGWMHPAPTPEELSNFYPTEYYGSGGAKFRRLFESAIRILVARRTSFLTAHLSPDAAVLDVGCGRGVLLRGLADRGYRVYGTERSAEAAQGADPRAEIRIAATLHDAAFEAEMFDMVVLWHVVEHLFDPRETLQEIHRILKPGGFVIVAVPNYSSWQSRWSGPHWFHLDPPRHLFHFSVNSLRRLLTHCGFQVRSWHHFSLRQNPFGWVQSALNRLDPADRNGLYSRLLLHADPKPPSCSRWRRWAHLTAFLLGMPWATALEIAATLFRRGATVHVVAKKTAPHPDAVPQHAPERRDSL